MDKLNMDLIIEANKWLFENTNISHQWFSGQLTDDITDVKNKQSIYLTTDINKAEIYGNVYSVLVDIDDINILDVNDDIMNDIVNKIFDEYDNENLSYNMTLMIDKVLYENNTIDDAKNQIYEELAPNQIIDESVYDEPDVQNYISELGYDMVIFKDYDTSILFDLDKCEIKYIGEE